MYFKKIRHENVLPDGTFSNQKGAVVTGGTIRMSDRKMAGDGYWLSVIQPRTEDGIVEGIEVIFGSKEEMEDFLKHGCING